MSPLLSFILLLVFLFLLSKAVSKSLGLLIYRLTGSKKLTIGSLAFIFLPGTVVHEFAHAAVAQGLGVHVGEIKLLPEIEDDGIKLGSVQVANCDPFRHFLIGVAPLIVGFVLVLLSIAIYAQLGLSGFWPALLLFYILFQIGNTMFSSDRDMEGAIELLIAVVLVFGFLHLVGLKGIFGGILQAGVKLEPFFKMASSVLLKIVVIDLVVIVAARLLNKGKRI